MADNKEDIEPFQEMTEKLTKENIKKLQNVLDMPAGLIEQIDDATDFLATLEKWDNFELKGFRAGLKAIGRADLVPIADKIPSLCRRKKMKIQSAKTFIDLLKAELTAENWKKILRAISVIRIGQINAEIALELCIENDLFANNIGKLYSILVKIKLNDLAGKVLKYESTFNKFSNQQLKVILKSNLNENIGQKNLIEFIFKESKDVSVLLGDKRVPIESIYIPLTVVEIKPGMEREVEESGLNEIEFLRQMNEQDEYETVEVVDFDKIVTSCDSSEKQLWCMIGNPGSGKSFLCKHFAHMYGTGRLNNFLYTVSIPCRSKEWHRLEEVRHEKNQNVDNEFVISWLLLSMSPDEHWSKCLASHLVSTKGEDLFIIIDGADEFTRSVPFETSLLYKLLARQFLPLSTILVTSRPSAWYDFKYKYDANFKSTNFQVLGFSPANRDVYFEKNIETNDKLKQVHEMFQLHNEIKQLSLVPVNASLFTALFNESKDILTETLSHLYTKLIVYLIRRQLSRMDLEEESKKLSMSEFHPAIRECINEVALEANQGIFERVMTSDKNISFEIDGKIYPSERFGLMQVHLKVDKYGVRVKVWAFQHLTIQEYMAAVSISNNSWPNQCFILRYITSSSQYISMYKMVIRFMAGILKEKAGRMTPILCRHTFPKPMSLREAPMCCQLRYDISLVDMSDWRKFTQSYLLLSTVIIETTSKISKHFAFLKKEFPSPYYLYFLDTVTPNEWHCFLQSLKYIREYQIVCIRSDFVTSEQFSSLLNKLNSYTCSLHYFALLFVEKDFDAIYPYINFLSSVSLPPNTKISINIVRCKLISPIPSQQQLFPVNKLAGSLRIDNSEIDFQRLDSLVNQFKSLDNFYYAPHKEESDGLIRVQIFQRLLAYPINGIYIVDRNDYLQMIPQTLSSVSKEIEWWTKRDSYKVLPYIQHLSSISYLTLFSTDEVPPDTSHGKLLTEIIAKNHDSLKAIYFTELHSIGIDSWSSFLNCIALCSNLMSLKLTYSEFILEDISWHNSIAALTSLVHLVLRAIPLRDSGMMELCHGLVCHPGIRRLLIVECELTSASCNTLSCLIQTLRKLRKITISKSELSRPNPEPLGRLQQTAKKVYVEVEPQD